MELSKKTTILLSPAMHKHLSRVAKSRNKSMGELVREACESHYGFVSPDERRTAAKELASMALPVGTVDEMKRQSVPDPDDAQS
jgi:hypothetical protein